MADSTNTAAAPDFKPSGGNHTHDTVLLEWTATDPSGAVFDGGSPRELLRWEQPFQSQRGPPRIQPDPPARRSRLRPSLRRFADGGSGGDPLAMAQNLNSAFGKVYRIDPLGTNTPTKVRNSGVEPPLPTTARRTRSAKSTRTAFATHRGCSGIPAPADVHAGYRAGHC
jgi:hypothetical protein